MRLTRQVVGLRCWRSANTTLPLILQTIFCDVHDFVCSCRHAVFLRARCVPTNNIQALIETSTLLSPCSRIRMYLHGEGLPGGRLPVGEYGAVHALRHGMHDLLGGAVIHRLCRAVLVEDAVVREEGSLAVRERVPVGRGLRGVRFTRWRRRRGPEEAAGTAGLASLPGA